MRARLQASIAASAGRPKSTGEFAAASASRWTMAGSASVTYQYGKDQSIAAASRPRPPSVDAALIYGDLLLRDRGERYDFTARVDAGYTQNLVTTFGGSQDRTTAAYVELTDRKLGLDRPARPAVARQSRAVIGLFDGVFVGYQLDPKFSISAAAGLPAYTIYSAFSTAQNFGTVSAEWDPILRWAVDGYLFDQMDSGVRRPALRGGPDPLHRARQHGGGPRRLRRDLQQLNSATLIGNAQGRRLLGAGL